MAKQADDYDRATSNTRSRDDLALATRIQHGDVDAFEALFTQYHASLVQFASHYVDSDVIADEVVVDVFVSIWNKRTTWIIRHSTVADYLYIAVRNRALNVAKTDRRRQKIQDTFTPDDDIPGLGATTLDIVERLHAEDVARQLERAIAELPERTRVAITLRWQQQMSYDQIAILLGTTSTAVQMQISRGLKILRELLASFPQ